MQMPDPISQAVTITGHWNFEYRYFAGAVASRFFNELKLNRRIMGTRVPSTGRVLVPARSFCDMSYERTGDWVEVGPDGTLDIFTIVAAKFPGLPDPPFVMGYVTLDGADTAVLNYVRGVDLRDIEAAGQELMAKPRVRAIFSDVREGRITDFHFELIAPAPV